MQSTTADPIQLLKSLAFVPFARADGAMHPTVFVGWTLNYEMMFYLLFALGMMLPGRRLGRRSRSPCWSPRSSPACC